jgi:DNA-directed RNA polymerase subunit M/transcription elongation factor TFIIS
MEKSRKKIFMIGIIAVSLITAGFITFSTMFNNSSDLNKLKGQTVWLKCQNSKCNHSFEMDMKDYYEQLQDNRRSNVTRASALTCPKCDERSAYEAFKCEQCGNIFFVDRTKRDYFDRCPKCGFSKEEKQRENAN